MQWWTSLPGPTCSQRRMSTQSDAAPFVEENESSSSVL